MSDIISNDEPGIDGLIDMAKDKAFLGGMQLAVSLPAALIANLEDEAEELAAQLRGEDYE